MAKVFDTGGLVLGLIHRESNLRKRLSYLVGFIRGVLIDDHVGVEELTALQAECRAFLEAHSAAPISSFLQETGNPVEDVQRLHQELLDQQPQVFTDERSEERYQINEFYGYCAGIASDNRIGLAEAEYLVAQICILPDHLIDSRIRMLNDVAIEALDDGVITDEESEDLCEWLTSLVGDSFIDTGLATYGKTGAFPETLRDVSQIDMKGANFVVTGTFSFAPRKHITRLLSDLGGSEAKSVSKSTRYLFIGGKASRDWVSSHAGTKLLRAQELRKQGAGPELVNEVTLIKLVQPYSPQTKPSPEFVLSATCTEDQISVLRRLETLIGQGLLPPVETDHHAEKLRQFRLGLLITKTVEIAGR